MSMTQPEPLRFDPIQLPDIGGSGTASRSLSFAPIDISTYDPQSQQSASVTIPAPPQLPELRFPKLPELTPSSSASPAPATPAPSSGPIIPNLPDATTALNNKYRRIGNALKDLDPQIVNALMQLDMERVGRGVQPLTDKETAAALIAVMNPEQATPEPETPWWNLPVNAYNNLKGIVTALPRLPGALVNEVQALPDFAQEYARLQDEGMNPVEALAASPGVRFLPGSFIAQNVAGGDLDELARNPVFTALDLMPGASKAAGATRAGRAAVEAAGAGARMSPVRAALTRRVAEAGEVLSPHALPVDEAARLVPNRLGRVTETLVHGTRPGQALSTALGAKARDASSLSARADIEAQSLLDPAGPATTDAGVLAARRARDFQTRLAVEKYGITPARAEELTPIAQVYDPAVISTLTPDEIGFLDEYRDISHSITRETLVKDIFDRGATEALVEFRGEFYPLQQGRRLVSTEQKANAGLGKMTENQARLSELIRQDRLANINVDPRLLELEGALEAADFKRANTILNGMLQQRTRVARGGNVGPKSVPKGNLRMGFLANMRRDVRSAEAAWKLHQRAISRAPGRFVDVIQKRAVDQYAAVLSPRNGMEASAIADRIFAHDYHNIPGFEEGALRQTLNDVEKTWQSIRDVEGFDPVYVHRAPVSAEFNLAFPKVWHTVSHKSQVKPRDLYNIRPHHQNMTVALSHQGLELITEKISQQLANDIIATFGRHEADLLDYYRPSAQALAARTPGLDEAGALQQLIKRDFAPYNPESKFWSTTKSLGVDPEQWWVPKSVVDTFDRLAPGPQSMNAIWDTGMAAFRTAVLPLSPRWHAYNIIGGMVMLMGQTGPSALKYLGQANKLRKAVREGADLADELPTQLRYSLGAVGRDTAEFNYMAGKSLRRWWDQVQTSKTQPIADAGSRAAQLGSKLVSKSFDMNAFFDDTYRIAGYLYGADKAAARGASKSSSIMAGLEMTRKVMADWTALTPIERSIIRRIFPFYSFMSFALKYVVQLPFDHPLRASIIGNMARAELEDWGAGMPMDMMSTLTIGDPDENGNVLGVNVGGANPFRDVADLMTLRGFIGNVNPFISTGLQQLGIEPMSGEAELFPELTYDPETGRLKSVSRGNPVWNLAQNTIPQTRLIGQMMGLNTRFRELQRTDPEAARRQLAVGLGIPFYPRTVNPIQRRIEAELARRTAQRDVFYNALKTGDDTEAGRWPGMEQMLARLRDLQSQQLLPQFTPQAIEPPITVEPSTPQFSPTSQNPDPSIDPGLRYASLTARM